MPPSTVEKGNELLQEKEEAQKRLQALELERNVLANRIRELEAEVQASTNSLEAI